MESRIQVMLAFVAALSAVVSAWWLIYLNGLLDSPILLWERTQRGLTNSELVFRLHNPSDSAIKDQDISIFCRTTPCFAPFEPGEWVKREGGRSTRIKWDETGEDQILLLVTLAKNEKAVAVVLPAGGKPEGISIQPVSDNGIAPSFIEASSITGFFLKYYGQVFTLIAAVAGLLLAALFGYLVWRIVLRVPKSPIGP